MKKIILKKVIKKIDKVLSKEVLWWFCVIFGLLLMIIPACLAEVIDISLSEPPFSFGVLYGVGACYSLQGYFDFFKKKKASDQEKTGH